MIRVGLVGCGRIAERGYAPAFRRASGVELVAVADPASERCQRVAPGLPSFPSARALLETVPVDALVLATPAAAHLPDARAAAEQGVPALIEKPPAPSLADARELAALDPRPSMGFNRRFVPEIARLRGLSSTGADPALHLELRTRPASWRAYVADEDVLSNLGPHPVDLARWLSGSQVERVRTELDGDSASLELQLSGASASIALHGDRPYRERVVVVAHGRPVESYGTGGPLAAARSLVSRGEHQLVASISRQLDAFAAAVRGEPADGLATAEDGVAVMAALEAARRSARAGGTWVDVTPG